MFGFRKRQTLAQSGFFRGFVDWHCHILPGVDDGVQTMDEALHILAAYERLGIREVWLTPHIMEDIPNPTARLRERFTELLAAYKGNVVLNLAAENMLDKIAEGRLNKFYQESTLLNQAFIKDGKESVRAYLAANDKELKVTGFLRFTLND